jgi:hypothetical protein
MIAVQHDKTLKINTHKGLSCDNEGFIRKLSDKTGRDLSLKKEVDHIYNQLHSTLMNLNKQTINF